MMPEKRIELTPPAEALETAALNMAKIALFAQQYNNPPLLGTHLRIAHLRFIKDTLGNPEDRWNAYLEEVATATDSADLNLVLKASTTFILNRKRTDDLAR